MTILAVLNDKKALDMLTEHIASEQPDAELLSFTESPDALSAARQKEVSVAFLAADLPEMNGWLLGQYLKDLYPYINLIYLSGKRSDAYDAIKLRSSGLILTPASREEVAGELSALRYSPDKNSKSRVFIQTFGNFELFVDGKPVNFKYTRTKEIVAMLVNNRGAQTTNGEIIANLWEDDGDPDRKASYLSNLRQDLQNTFTRLKLNGLILKQRGSLAIATDRVECDLFEWLDKKKESRYQYMGDYMNQYSWPEYFHATLDEISYAMDDED